jgi:hypothetical protein
VNSRNEVRGIFDPYIPRYVSINASYRHNEELLDNDYHHENILQHGVVKVNAVVGVGELVVYLKPDAN